MADEENQAAGEDADAAPAAGKKKLIIIAAAALLVVSALAAGGVYYWLSLSADEACIEGEVAAGEEGAGEEVPGDACASDEGVAEGDESAEAAVDVPSDRPLYHQLRPEFLITFDANNRQRYVKVEVTLVTRKPQMIETLTVHDPLIRNTLIMLLSRQDYLELQSEPGKARLKVEAIEAINKLLVEEVGEEGVEKVLFTDFVMQ